MNEMADENLSEGLVNEAAGGNESPIAALFGAERLTYDELMMKAGMAGLEIGDIGGLRDEFNGRIHEIRCRGALERELDKSGAINGGLVTRVIDFSKVTSDEDGVYGLSEQIAELKKSDPYLFKGAGDDYGLGKGASVVFSSGLAHGGAVSDPDSLDDSDFYRRVKKI